jgi:hypothetical protein
MKQTAIDGCARVRKLEASFLLIVFLTFLCLPLLGVIFHLDAAPIWENRRLAPFPAVSARPRDILNFPVKYAYYFKDHFAFRGRLVQAQAVLRVRWLRTSSSPSVILGKDGWLFYSGEQLADYYGATRPFSDDEMARWLRVMEANSDWLKQRGIKFYFVIVPEKQTIYPEYMPDNLVPVRPHSRLDQLIEYFKAHSSLEIMDLRPALWEEKARHRLYSRTNSHWNELGAFVFYQAMIRKISKSFPALHPLSESDFSLVTEYGTNEDLTGLLGLNGLVSEEKLSLNLRQPSTVSGLGKISRPSGGQMYWAVTEKNEPGLPRLILFHDSFGDWLVEFLAENFGHAMYVYPQRMNSKLVESEAPDVVVVEMCERFLMTNPEQYQVSAEDNQSSSR